MHLFVCYKYFAFLFALPAMPATRLELKLKVNENELIKLLDTISGVKNEIAANLVADSRRQYCGRRRGYFQNKPDSNGNLNDRAVKRIMCICQRVHFYARKIVKLMRCVSFERMMGNLLTQAYADIEDSDSETDTYLPSNKSITEAARSNLTNIGDGSGTLILPSDFNLETDSNVEHCDEIITNYTDFLSTYTSFEEGGLRNARMIQRPRLMRLRSDYCEEYVKRIAPTINNADCIVNLLGNLEDYFHKEFLRSLRTMPTSFAGRRW